MFFYLSHYYFTMVCLVWLLWTCEMHHWAVWDHVRGAVHKRTMVSISFLAQASTSRLGETNRGSLWFFCASCRLSDESLFWASHSLAQARKGSPKRESAWSHCSPFRALAWARGLSRLSKALLPKREAGQGVRWFCGFCFWMLVICLDWLCILKHELSDSMWTRCTMGCDLWV